MCYFCLAIGSVESPQALLTLDLLFSKVPPIQFPQHCQQACSHCSQRCPHSFVAECFHVAGALKATHAFLVVMMPGARFVAQATGNDWSLMFLQTAVAGPRLFDTMCPWLYENLFVMAVNSHSSVSWFPTTAWCAPPRSSETINVHYGWLRDRHLVMMMMERDRAFITGPLKKKTTLKKNKQVPEKLSRLVISSSRAFTMDGWKFKKEAHPVWNRNVSIHLLYIYICYI